ncbi:cysteine-rich repeat secretory protein 3-like [Dorcoceras hygrometricum]|uniref:Cysteine-rich repeat secretory protein 3-like n=1 Tax=Dorcoceras hygrometricum TaxID=472368 RepID=A0A2Z7BHU7_9LAMI|nr:cysteine-rich repeat secretory protein 3-like [Dorcoceras hygrometricum]
MDFPRNPLSSFGFLLLILSIFELAPPSNSADDYTSLVYKGCANQPLSDPSGVYSQAISSLYGTLIAQSSKARFFKTAAGTSQSTINGLFQCRGDLSNVDCYNCVSGLPVLIDKLCGKAIAARVQLSGCYMLYEVAGFQQVSGMQLLYKSCSATNMGGAGFEERRDTALSSLENGMVSNSNGFYASSYEAVYALGQCEGDVGASDCVSCVQNAVQRAQVECGSSISGHIYLQKCFITYSYYPNGVPKKSSSSSYTSSSSDFIREICSSCPSLRNGFTFSRKMILTVQKLFLHVSHTLFKFHLDPQYATSEDLYIRDPLQVATRKEIKHCHRVSQVLSSKQSKWAFAK